MKVKILILVSTPFKICSRLLFKYRLNRFKIVKNISYGDLIKIKRNNIVLKHPNTENVQNKEIQKNSICVFVGVEHKIKEDDFPRIIILHEGKLSTIDSVDIENLLERV